MSDKLTSGFYVYTRLLKYVRRYWVAFIIAILGNILYAGIDSGFTYMLKPLLDKGFIAREQAFIYWIPFITLFAFVLRGASNFMSNYFMTLVGRSVVMTMRQEIFKKYLQLPARYFDNHSSGQMLSAVIYNSEQVADASTDALTTALQSGVMIIGLFSVMFIISWKLTLLYIVTAPVIALTVRLSSQRLRSISKSIQDSMSHVTNVVEECIEGYQVVRTFGGQDHETKKFNAAVDFNRRRELKLVVTKTLTVSGVQLIAACAVALTIYLSISGTNVLTAGSFAAILGAMLAVLKPMKDITNVNSTIQKGIAGAQSIFGLLDEEVEKDHGARPLVRANGQIEFREVTFAYTEAKGRVLKKINLHIEPGQTVALVGKSGGGKSTLVKLLPRFYEVNQGEILLDGHNIQEYPLKDLRRQIAVVSQHVTLFNDTIANNIAYGCFASASRDSIIKAAIAANAYDFIQELPQGIDTIIGENGVLLSGGQRQRLAIARALLQDAPILILDEATSALDSESERYIQSALEQLMKTRTTLVIAHRLSTIEKADQIVVIEKGNIVELGTHAELVQQQGMYTKLHAMQFSGLEHQYPTAQLANA